MSSEYEMESTEYLIQKMFDKYDLESKRFSPGGFDFWITRDAPQASTLIIQINTKSLRNNHKTNSATIIGVVSKKETKCKKLPEDYGYIKMTDTHFKTEGDFCYYHYYGEGPKLNKMISEAKQTIRDLVREHKRRKK